MTKSLLRIFISHPWSITVVLLETGADSKKSKNMSIDLVQKSMTSGCSREDFWLDLKSARKMPVTKTELLSLIV